MRTNGKFKRISYDYDGNVEVTLSVTDKAVVAKLHELGTEKLLTIDIKQFRNARSLEANRYAWELIGQIATVLKTDSESIYEKIIIDGNNFRMMPYEDINIDYERGIYRFLVEAKETTLIDKNGNSHCFVWCKCYKGSSEYDTKEMAQFIDDIIDEAQALGIDTRTPKEIEQMKSAWKQSKSNVFCGGNEKNE